MAKTRKPKPSPEAARAQGAQAKPSSAASPVEGTLLDMREAIELLKTSQPTFHRWLKAGRIKGMKVGRQWRFYRGDIERLLRGEGARLVLPADPRPLLDALSERLAETGGADFSGESADEIERAVNLTVALAVALGASDLHVAPMVVPSEDRTMGVIRYRIDGVLHEVARFDARLLPLIIERWKSISGCDVRETSLPQDGRAVMQRPSKDGLDPERRIDMRVSYFPTALGESLTVRVLDPGAVSLDLAKIDFAPRDRERLTSAIRAPHGAVIFTGPTGCGKTTTIYSALNEIAGPGLKVMTVEDPVEYVLPYVLQAPLNTAAGMTLERAARAMLRSDVDVMFICEIRNSDILNAVIQGAMTGHLVLSTLHAPDAPGALRRMLDMGVQPFMISSAVRLVQSQRLIRTLCPSCSKPYEPSREDLDWAERAAREGGLDWGALKRGFREAVGCRECGRTGYKGRTIATETLEMSPDIVRVLEEDAQIPELRRLAVKAGMTTMAADGVRRAAAGLTSLEEVRRVLS